MTNNSYPVTNALILMNVLMFLLGVLSGMYNEIVSVYAFSAAKLTAQQWSAVFVSGFLHSDFVHLTYNMAFLWIFGLVCEDVFGRLKTVFLYVTAMVTGSLFFALLFPAESAIGASGAVSGLVAAAILIEPGRDIHPRIESFPIIFLAFVFLFPTALNAFNLAGNTANIAHVGGAVAGAILTTMWRPKPALEHMRDLWILWALFGLVLLILAASLVY